MKISASELRVNKAKVRCELCDLATGCFTNKINPIGHRHPDILFIDDSPSQSEDRDAKIMHSGLSDWFRKQVKAVGLDRWRIRYTKAIRCTPQGNVNLGYIKACRENLLAEIERTKPKVIVAIGNRALYALTGVGAGISSLAGTIIETEHDAKVYAMLNYGGVAYNQETKIRIIRDLETLRDEVMLGKKKVLWEPDIIIPEKESEVKLLLKEFGKKRVNFDYETSHITTNPFKAGKLTCMSLTGPKDRTLVLPFKSHPDCPKWLRKYHAKKVFSKYHDFDAETTPDATGPYKAVFRYLSRHKNLGAFNAAFETIWSKVYGFDVRFRFDAMLAHYQLDPDAKGTHGLDDLCQAYIPKAGTYWKDIPPLSKTDTRDIPGDLLFRYNGFDSAVDRLLKPILTKVLDKKFGEHVDWRETQDYFMRFVTPTLARLQFNGWCTDRNRLDEVSKHIKGKITKYTNKLDDQDDIEECLRLVDKERKAKHKARSRAKYPDDLDKRLRENDKFKPTEKYNSKSAIHSKVLIYQVLTNEDGENLPVTILTQAKQPSCEHKKLESLLKAHFGVTKKGNIKSKTYRLRHVLNQYRHYNSTYVDSVIERHLCSDGYVHPSYLQHGVATVRLSSRDPNGQNFPERNAPVARILKSPYISRFKNGRLVGADYGQIEPRVSADLARDLNMLGVFTRGEDIYMGIAYKVFVNIGTQIVTKKKAKKDLDTLGKKARWRFMSKQILLAVLYGKGAFSLAADLGCSEREAQDIIDAFYDGFPKTRKYQEKSLKIARKRKWCVTKSPVFARMVPDITCAYDARKPTKRMWSKQSQQERLVGNSPIQGQAAMVTLIAQHHIARRFREEGLRAVLFGLIHDACYADCHPKDVDRAQFIIEDTMINIATIEPLLNWMTVILTADAKRAKNWGGLVEG